MCCSPLQENLSEAALVLILLIHFLYLTYIFIVYLSVSGSSSEEPHVTVSSQITHASFGSQTDTDS